MTGNSQQGQLVLHDDIRGVYGPVAHWNDKLNLSAKERGPREIGFFSDVLTARQSPGAQPKTTALELEAGGNVEVYGQTFSAQANRLTYVQDKKQLVFEGDSRSGAELYYQPQAGSTWTRARTARIEYWPATRQTNIHDAQFLDLGQIGDAGPSRLPSAAR